MILRTLRRVVDGLVVVVFGYMVLAVVAQVAGRYLPGVALGNAVESATFAQIWLTTLGAGLALRTGAIFSLDTVTRHLSLGPARAFSLIIAAISLGFVAVMVYGGILLTMQGTGQRSPVLLIPMWTIFISIPVGMTLLGIEIVVRVIERWNAPFAAIDEELA
jgi:TRAP-type C4-dicarboxylate transport system permease small subunit